MKREEPYKVNELIRAREVRLVSDDGAEVLSLSAALEKATQADLDLVEISPNAKPPVCKIIDYKKFLFEQKKKQKELKSKQSKVTIKEIRFGPNTEDHDFQFKLKHAKGFLSEGAKVKAFVFFKGRSIVFKDRGSILLLKFAQELEDYGVIEQMPKLEGKKMIMMINPKKKS
ncbi:translation initiation factor IF-3 [Putridiphycobacter roseus]|uniref:Translation initiation factor IF-3 n=1 Tax=Putridiphycobacter roseus TaxID=2219161 RepID=A0A2W1NL52_9FLAO|nr:translation initiation factor IF-3 [Putridiphycobacter roseus]PZE18576.1 translation initiation factor IF-3 [Putridiphycobacter roseus]